MSQGFSRIIGLHQHRPSPPPSRKKSEISQSYSLPTGNIGGRGVHKSCTRLIPCFFGLPHITTAPRPCEVLTKRRFRAAFIRRMQCVPHCLVHGLMNAPKPHPCGFTGIINLKRLQCKEKIQHLELIMIRFDMHNSGEGRDRVNKTTKCIAF